MILDAPILALLLGSLLMSGMLLYAVVYGIQIIRHWDIASGSERQLLLERKTYLISTIVNYAFAFQLLSFFLFIYTADDLCTLFVGAMCAAGTLNVNAFGYPTLILKLISFLLAGTWLIVNTADNKAHDYPLIRYKYWLLVGILPVVLAETVVQLLYFGKLEPNIITSCCGTLFSAETPEGASGLAGLPIQPVKAAFYGSLAALISCGVWFYRTLGKSGYLFSLLSLGTLLSSITALITVISLYFYELPTHHCPFCVLQREYSHIGYLLYALLLGGAVAGLGIGALMPFRTRESLAVPVTGMLRTLTIISAACFTIFALISTWQMLFTDFRLEGY